MNATQAFRENGWNLAVLREETQGLSRLLRGLHGFVNTRHLQEELQQNILVQERAENRQDILMQTLSAVSDEKLKKLLFIRLVQGYSWERCAQELGKSVAWVYWKSAKWREEEREEAE